MNEHVREPYGYDERKSPELCANSMSSHAGIKLDPGQTQEYISLRINKENKQDLFCLSDQEILYSVLSTEQKAMFKAIFRHINFRD